MLVDILQTVANGIVIGGCYALTAVGLTLIFGFMGLVNFAHGEIYMLGAYFAFTFIVLLKLPYISGILLAILVVMLLGYLFEWSLFAPLRTGNVEESHTASMLTTVGLMIALQNIAIVIWNASQKRVPVPQQFEASVIQLFESIRISPIYLIILVVAVLIIVLAHLIIQYTKVGCAMRATFQDKETVGLMGVDAKRIFGFTMALGSGLAASGGALLSMIYIISPTMGALATLKAFAIVNLGGHGSFMGAIVGALILGVSETITATYISAGYKDAVAFIILLGILVVKPSGIFGKVRGVE